MNKYAGSALAALLLFAAAPASAAPSAAVMAAVSDPARPANDTAVDPMRKPAETLEFAGIKPGDKVAELNPGGGYFTRVIARTVGANGKVFTYGPPPRNPPPAGAVPITQTYTNVTPLQGMTADFAVPEAVDVVWTSRNYHDFQNAMPDMGPFNRKVFAALKPGGIYIVLDHAAAANGPDNVTSTLHRAKEATVRAQVEAAGFRFVSSSNVLSNPADDGTKPVREQDVAGKTNQFILKFQKPN